MHRPYRQAALKRQDLSCTYLAYHELESVIITTITTIIVTTVIIIIIITSTTVIMVIIIVIITAAVVVRDCQRMGSLAQSPCTAGPWSQWGC